MLVLCLLYTLCNLYNNVYYYYTSVIIVRMLNITYICIGWYSRPLEGGLQRPDQAERHSHAGAV